MPEVHVATLGTVHCSKPALSQQIADLQMMQIPTCVMRM